MITRSALSCLLVLYLIVFTHALAGVPQLISYQGHLSDSLGVPLDTVVDIRFTIYNDTLGSTELWTEVHSGMHVSGGMLSVLLGSVSSFVPAMFDGSIRGLTLRIGDGPESSPFTPLVSVAYSQRATYSDTSGYALSAHGGGNGGWVDSGTIVLLNDETDSVGIGTSAPQARLHVVGEIIGTTDLKIGGTNFLSDTAAIAAGYGNSVSGAASVAFGRDNYIVGKYSSIAGLEDSIVGDGSTIAGGWQNSITGHCATIAGGYLNTSQGWCSSVGGGESNHADSAYAVVGGGQYNTAVAQHSVVTGGSHNVVEGNESAVLGGAYNAVHAERSCILGGSGNTIETSATNSCVFGSNTTLSDANTFVVGVPNIVLDGTTSTQVLRASDGIELKNGGGPPTVHIFNTGEDGGAIYVNDENGTSFAQIYPYAGGTTGGFYLNGNATFAGSAGVGHRIEVGSDTPGGGIELKNGGGPPTVHIFNTGEDGGAIYVNDENGTSFAQIYPYAGGTTGGFYFNGNATFTGTASTGVLQITGGADVAEPFDITGDKQHPPGAVVVIDEFNPGQLTLSRERYDRKVAGVISGAGGVQPGLTLRQAGVVDGEQNVALSGRVYVLASTENGPIRPGDRLTTSSQPGHSMRATDPVLCDGAVLGKAMTSLASGDGFVLVLVNLQ